MFYLATFISIFVFLLNSFGISKIFKRFFKNTNILFCYTLGFISTFIAFSLPLIPFSFIKINISSLNYIYLGIQIILLIAYLINWRWFLITWKIDWKKLLIFLLVFFAIAIGWLFTYKFEEIKNFEFIIDKNISSFLNLANANSKDIFIFGNNNLIERPLFFNLLVSYLSIFELAESQINMFVNIFILFLYMFFFALVIMVVFLPKKTWSISNITKLIFFTFIISFFNVSLDKNLMCFSQWLMPLMILLIWLHYTKYNEVSYSLSLLSINIIVATALSLNIFFLLPFTIINIIIFGISFYIKKPNATNYNIYNLFVILCSWSLLINIKYLSIIIFCIFLLFYIFYIFYRNTKLGNKINSSIDKFLYKWISFILFFIATIIFLTITLYYVIRSDYSDIGEVWKIHHLFEITDKNFLLVVNIIYWLLNVFLLMYSIVQIYLKKRIIYSSNYIEITFISILLFWNPFSLILINKIFTLNIFSFSIQISEYINLFQIIIIPFVMRATKNYINSKKKSVYNFNYISLMSLSTLASILLINLL